MYVVTYSKAGASDTIDVSTTTTTNLDSPIKSVKFACASDDTAGAEDPLTYSDAVITLSANTGAGRALVIGLC